MSESAMSESGAGEPVNAGGLSAEEHYRREKARRDEPRAKPDSDPLEEARREYRAMLEADAARQKGGRPRKTAARKPEPDETAEADLDEVDDTEEVTDHAALDDGSPPGEKE